MQPRSSVASVFCWASEWWARRRSRACRFDGSRERLKVGVGSENSVEWEEEVPDLWMLTIE